MSIRTYCYGLMTDRAQGPLDGCVKSFLWLLSLLYGALARARRCAYACGWLRPYRSLKPVISVGNITLGGVGKTPLTIAIVRALTARQIRAAVLIRGYMPKDEICSDEALMLKDALPGVPILTGANRRRSIEDCLKHHAVDVFVCDDAFGHLQLARDLDIVAVDAYDPFGNGQVVPRGILRESLGALLKVDMMVMTKTDREGVNLDALQQRLSLLAPKACIVASIHMPAICVDVFEGTRVDVAHFKGLSIVAFCGIGDTASFRSTLKNAGFRVVDVVGYMDHHVYTPEDMIAVRKMAYAHQVHLIVTTHKDAVKLSAFKEIWHGYNVYYLGIDLEITHGKNVFLERIMSVIRH